MGPWGDFDGFTRARFENAPILWLGNLRFLERGCKLARTVLEIVLETFLEIIASLGAEVSWTGENEVTIDTRGIRTDSIDSRVSTVSRSSESSCRSGALVLCSRWAALPAPVEN